MLAAISAANVAESATLPAADFYVSVQGNDSWSGKLPDANGTDGPFRTLERARNEVRRIKADVADRPITVIVRGGIYTLNKSFVLEAQDSGTSETPVVYQACPGEKVILSGGQTISPDAFGPVTDDTVLERLGSEARGHVLQTDLNALGISDLGELPVKFKGAPEVPELFFNDKRMTLARWPNEDWTTIEKIISPGSVPRYGDKGNEGGVFEYSGDRPSRWNVEEGVWLHGYWCYDWSAEVIQVKSVDCENRRITLAAPSTYSVRQGNPSPRRYYALNLLEELDRSGEYYIDRAARVLYFWPPASLEGARIVMSTFKEPLVVIKDAENIILRGFIVESSLGNGIGVLGGSNVRVQACEVRNMRRKGIQVSGGTDHKIEACDVHDTGTGGIILSGGDRKTLTPARHEAINNHIWDFSQLELTYSNALFLDGVGNRAAHNLVHDAPHQAIAIGGNDHIFEYNIIHHICMATDDCGACYKGRNPSCRGNIIRYNYWHNIGRAMGHGSAAIYFDDGDGGDTVFGNIFYRCGDPGKGSFGTVFSHGGHDNLAENNIFIECKRALGSAPWNDERWKETVEGGQDCHWTRRLLEEVDITKPPYTTRYPSLIGFMDPKPGQIRVNRAVRNVFVNCAETSSGNWQVPLDTNWVTEEDPGFIDSTQENFELKPDAKVFERLPGFQPIPFEKIGLFKDELRSGK